LINLTLPPGFTDRSPSNTMHLPTISRRVQALALPVLFSLGMIAAARAAAFPPLNLPASTEHHQGKLVWADLFTADPAGATKFYCGLLGWTAATLDQKGKSYTVFSSDGRPVAGLAPRTVKGANHPSRWIGYYAVADVAAVLRAVPKAGGSIHAPAREFPDRGQQAIIADKDDIPIGLLQSSTGDSADGEPKPGDWNWFELYVKAPKDTAEFYHATIGLDLAPEMDPDRKSEYVLSSSGQARGGIAPLPEDNDARPSWLGVVRVADLDATLAKVPALGGEVLVAPHAVEAVSPSSSIPPAGPSVSCNMPTTPTPPTAHEIHPKNFAARAAPDRTAVRHEQLRRGGRGRRPGRLR
jgi:predicted enzyme related to lactoylglutathione lyase